MKRLGIGPVSWVGTSMGGLLGLHMAALEPARVEALVLNDVGAELDGAELMRLRTQTVADVAFGTLDEAEAWFRQRYAAFGKLSDQRWRAFTETSVLRGREGALKPCFDTRAAPRTAVPARVDLWDTYRAVRCPTLVLRGAESALLDRATCEAMRNCGPKADWIEVPAAGHAPDLSDPALIESIAQFLIKSRSARRASHATTGSVQ